MNCSFFNFFTISFIESFNINILPHFRNFLFIFFYPYKYFIGSFPDFKDSRKKILNLQNYNFWTNFHLIPVLNIDLTKIHPDQKTWVLSFGYNCIYYCCFYRICRVLFIYLCNFPEMYVVLFGYYFFVKLFLRLLYCFRAKFFLFLVILLFVVISLQLGLIFFWGSLFLIINNLLLIINT